MKRFWMVVLAAVCLSSCAVADNLNFPDSIPGTTVVLATNGTESVGSYGGEEQGTYANGGCCADTQIFTYQNGIYTSVYPLPYSTVDTVITDIQLNSSGVFAGTYGLGYQLVSFASICSTGDCLNHIVYDDFFGSDAHENPTPTINGVERRIYGSYAAWNLTTTVVDNAGDVIGTFQNFAEDNCDATTGGSTTVTNACVGGTFAIHDGQVYLDYNIEANEDGGVFATVNEFTFDGTNLSIPEPSSIWLLAPGLIFAVRLRRNRTLRRS